MRPFVGYLIYVWLNVILTNILVRKICTDVEHSKLFNCRQAFV